MRTPYVMPRKTYPAITGIVSGKACFSALLRVFIGMSLCRQPAYGLFFVFYEKVVMSVVGFVNEVVERLAGVA